MLLTKVEFDFLLIRPASAGIAIFAIGLIACRRLQNANSRWYVV